MGCDDHVAKILSMAFARTASFRERATALSTDTTTSDRQILRMANLPRVCMQDIAENSEMVEALIELDDDEALKGTLTMERVWLMCDKEFNWTLSGQSSNVLRGVWHRFEGDKLRLIWAKFLRELARSKFSDDMEVWKLKQAFLDREKAKTSAAVPAARPIDVLGRAIDVEAIQCGGVRNTLLM
jgi:hypothetical protein